MKTSKIKISSEMEEGPRCTLLALLTLLTQLTLLIVMTTRAPTKTEF